MRTDSIYTAMNKLKLVIVTLCVFATSFSKAQTIHLINLNELVNLPLYINHNELVQSLLEGVKSGEIVSYRANAESSSRLTMDEFWKNMEIPSMDISYDEEYDEDEFCFCGDDDDITPDNRKEPEPEYFWSTDLYRFALTRDANNQIEYLTIFLPGDHPDNIIGVQKLIAKFVWSDCKKIFDARGLMWHNPYNTQDQMNMSAALEKEMYSPYVANDLGDAVTMFYDCYKSPEGKTALEKKENEKQLITQWKKKSGAIKFYYTEYYDIYATAAIGFNQQPKLQTVLIQAVKTGQITPYFYTKAKRWEGEVEQMTMEEFIERLKQDEEAHDDPDWCCEFDNFDDVDDWGDEDETNNDVYYWEGDDLMFNTNGTMTIDAKGNYKKEPEYINLYVPAEDEWNIKGFDMTVAKFRFQEVIDFLNTIDSLKWKNPFDANLTKPLGKALEEDNLVIKEAFYEDIFRSREFLLKRESPKRFTEQILEISLSLDTVITTLNVTNNKKANRLNESFAVDEVEGYYSQLFNMQIQYLKNRTPLKTSNKKPTRTYELSNAWMIESSDSLFLDFVFDVENIIKGIHPKADTLFKTEITLLENEDNEGFSGAWGDEEEIQESEERTKIIKVTPFINEKIVLQWSKGKVKQKSTMIEFMYLKNSKFYSIYLDMKMLKPLKKHPYYKKYRNGEIKLERNRLQDHAGNSYEPKYGPLYLDHFFLDVLKFSKN